MAISPPDATMISIAGGTSMPAPVLDAINALVADLNAYFSTLSAPPPNRSFGVGMMLGFAIAA